MELWYYPQPRYLLFYLIPTVKFQQTDFLANRYALCYGCDSSDTKLAVNHQYDFVCSLLFLIVIH